MKHLFLAACIALLVLTPALAFSQARTPPAGATSVGSAAPRGGDSGGGTTSSPGGSGGAVGSGSSSGGGGGSNSSGGNAIGRGDSYAGSRSFGTGAGGYNAPRGIDRENGPRSGESFATPRSSDYSRPEARGYANVRGAAPSVGQPVPGQTRPRGDGPTVGQAVPRGNVTPKPPDNGGYYPPDYGGWYGNAGWWPYYGYGYYWGACYWNSWYCGWSPFYSGFEPYWYYQWYSPWSVWDDWSQMGYAYGGGSYMNEGMGGIRFKVKPKEAEIWADGYFEGQVTDYSGGKGLQLKAGMHHIEIKAKGYETITVDLRAMPGKVVTYTGEMKAAPK